MVRGIHGLPKVSPGPAMTNPSTPFRRVTPKMALRPFLEGPTRKAGGLQPFSTPFDTPCRTGLIPSSITILGSHLQHGWVRHSQGVLAGRHSVGYLRGQRMAAGHLPCGQATPKTTIRPFGALKGRAWRSRVKL
jgi:hypothetical protein